jgi:hypothetical protein
MNKQTEMAKQILKEFPGLRGFGMVDGDGCVYTNEGLILAYKNHVLALDVANSRVIDCGVFLPALSNITLEEFCICAWQEHFGQKCHACGLPTDKERQECKRNLCMQCNLVLNNHYGQSGDCYCEDCRERKDLKERIGQDVR